MEALKIELIPSNGLTLHKLIQTSDDGDMYIVKMSDDKVYFLLCFKTVKSMIGIMNNQFYFDFDNLDLVSYRKIKI